MTNFPIPRGEIVETADARIVMSGVPWSLYETQLALRRDTSGPRIAYLDGDLELMSRSKDHERIKSYLGRLVEAFALERDVDLSPYGSWTLKDAPKRAGVEPDECCLVGANQARSTPDLVIEVIWTSGGIDKLEAYRRLKVPEVWFWEEGAIHVHVLEVDRYERRDRSACFPDLDVLQLASFIDHPTAMQAVKAFRLALRASD